MRDNACEEERCEGVSAEICHIYNYVYYIYIYIYIYIYTHIFMLVLELANAFINNVFVVF